MVTRYFNDLKFGRETMCLVSLALSKTRECRNLNEITGELDEWNPSTNQGPNMHINI